MNSDTGILIIEDDRNLCSFMTTGLIDNGYHVTPAFTGSEGLRLAASTNPDIILLDLGLPDMDGFDTLKSLQGWSKTPVIVISARSGEEDKVRLLDAGADDYLTKPFGLAELMARIRTRLRRNISDIPSPVYRALDLEIQFDKRRIFLCGEEIHLTQVEYRLLTLLAENSGHVLTYEFIMNAIWGPYIENDNRILRVNMANIRRKIEKDPSHPQYVFTEAGVGYRMPENETPKL